MEHFADRVRNAVNSKGNPIVIGLDPRLECIPPHLLSMFKKMFGDTDEAIAKAFWHFNRGIIDAVHDIVPAVKLQLAFYERYGLAGLNAYVQTNAYAKEKGLLVIADAKRNDIGSTASAYAEAYLNNSGDFVADAVTVNPLFGTDGILPFVDRATRHGKGVFVLVKTSNMSSIDTQDLELSCGIPFYERIGKWVEMWGHYNRSDDGYSCVGAVVGATFPEQALRLRSLMPHTIFLVPGYGAQGATADDVMRCFDGQCYGALVTASRSIICAWEDQSESGYDYDVVAREAVKRMNEDLREAAWRR